jgi:hypothetical protein
MYEYFALVLALRIAWKISQGRLLNIAVFWVYNGRFALAKSRQPLPGLV